MIPSIINIVAAEQTGDYRIRLTFDDGTAQVMKLIVARERAGRVAVQYAAENKK